MSNEEKDAKVVSFYRKWCTLLQEQEHEREHWKDHTFLCIPLPNGFLGGLEEQIFLTIQRFEWDRNSSYQPGEVTAQIEAILNAINEKRSTDASHIVDKYGFYNQKCQTQVPQSSIPAIASEGVIEDDAAIAARLQREFDAEHLSESQREQSDNNYAHTMSASHSIQPPASIGATKPPCRYGYDCYRKNPKHFADYSHPIGYNSVKQFNTATRPVSQQADLDDDVSLEDSRSEDSEIDEDFMAEDIHPPPAVHPWNNPFGSGRVPLSTVHVDSSLIPSIQETFPNHSVDKIIDALKQSNNNPNVACQLLLESGLK